MNVGKFNMAKACNEFTPRVKFRSVYAFVFRFACLPIDNSQVCFVFVPHFVLIFSFSQDENPTEISQLSQLKKNNSEFSLILILKNDTYLILKHVFGRTISSAVDSKQCQDWSLFKIHFITIHLIKSSHSFYQVVKY